MTYSALSSAPACSVEKQVLENGVTLMVDRSEALRAFAFSVSFIGGSRDETPQNSGLTHLLEHLLFKRTQTKNTCDVAAVIDRFGGEVNAFTDPDSFTLYGVVPRSRKTELLEFVAELIFESTFTERDLDLEKEIVRQEILEAEDDPAELVLKEFSRLFWSESSLSYPVYGTVESVEGFTVEDVREHLRRSSVGSRILICASGDIRLDELREYAEGHFAKLPQGSPRRLVTPRCGSGVSLVPKSSNQCQLRIGLPWTGMADEDYIAGIVASTVLGDCTSSRLFQSLREERGLAYDVSASIEAYCDIGGLIITAAVEKKNVFSALELMASELRALSRDGLTGEELSRVKGMLTAQIEMQTDSARSRLWQLMECEINIGRYVSNEEVNARLEALTTEQVARVVQKHSKESQVLVVAGGDIFSLPQGRFSMRI